MRLKSRCCEKFVRKAKACKGCPLFALLGEKKRKQRLRELAKERKRAA